MTYDEQIEVIQAAKEGRNIEARRKDSNYLWSKLPKVEHFDFCNYEYRVEKELKYRPFKSADEAFQEAKKHGFWVNEKSSGYYHAITFIRRDLVYIGEYEFEYKGLLDKFTWADDGTPCGILEE